MIGSILNNRYRIDEEIGGGGMGTVYRGYDTMLERGVAIKVLSKAGLGTEGRGKLLSEAQMAAKLNHPNIVTVYDVGEEGGTPFIVMEYVEGKSLHDDPPKSVDETLAIMRQLCAGLEHAHGQGIIHRDLKPENVVITRDGTAKLMDFGLARSMASRYSMDGMVAGTVFYLAPEQALGQEIDQRTDLYSLGVMLYELTTGELPFVDQDPIAVISQHLHAPVVPPRAKNKEIPQVLNELILQLMSKDPRDRPSSVSEVLQILETPEIATRESTEIEEMSLLDRIVRGRMVGREREFLQARQLWQNASSGEGQLLLINGEPGIGKTRLTREIATQAEVSGGQVLVGECQAEGNTPYAPFAQITRRALRSDGFTFPKIVMAELVALSPELGANYPDVERNPKLDPEAEQRRRFESVVEFCHVLSQDSPLLLVLEDLHWADSGSLRMLEHLARRTRQMPVMLLGTYRELELDEALPLHETLLGLDRRRLGRRVKLERLNKDATRDMLKIIFAEEITPGFLEGIYKETEGNPFFVEEVSKALIESGQVWFEGGRWQRAPDMAQVFIPQGVKVAIQSRLRVLTKETKGALLTAAVIGREFDFQTLEVVSGMDEERLIDSLEEAIKKQLIEETREGGGELFMFTHALVPATLRDGISGLRRTRLHRQMATAIEELHPEKFEQLAYHWGEAGDEENGLVFTIKAADRAREAYVNEDAVRLYSEALALLPENHPERFELLTGRAEVYDVMAEREAQLRDLQAMVKLAEEQGDESRQVDALLGLASLYLETETAKAREPLEQALKVSRDLDDIGQEGRALLYFGRLANLSVNYFKAIEYFEASAAIFQQAGLISESAESLSDLSLTLGYLGDPAALNAAQEAADLSTEVGDKLLEAISLRRLAIAYIDQYQYPQALPIAEKALQMSREIGDLLNEMAALNVLALIKKGLGQTDEAEAGFLEGITLADKIGNEDSIRMLIGNLSDIANWHRGEYRYFLKFIKDLEINLSHYENDYVKFHLQLIEINQLILMGRYRIALSLCEINLQKLRDSNDFYHGWTILRMARLCAELDKGDQADHYLDEAGELLSSEYPFWNFLLDFYTARVILLLGDISKFEWGVDTINGNLPFLRERGDKNWLGDSLLAKAQLHLTLLRNNQSHGEIALACTAEAIECYQIHQSRLFMPEQIHFQHSRALRVNGREDEADEYLRQAYERMMMVARKIEDEDLRRSYLENVRDNRELQAAYQERFG